MRLIISDGFTSLSIQSIETCCGMFGMVTLVSGRYVGKDSGGYGNKSHSVAAIEALRHLKPKEKYINSKSN